MLASDHSALSSAFRESIITLQLEALSIKKNRRLLPSHIEWKPNMSVPAFVNRIILLLVILAVTRGQAQVSPDSLPLIWKNETAADSLRFQAINKYYKSQTHAQPDSVLVLTQFHYDLAFAKDSKLEMANALNERSYAHYIKGDTKQSLDALNQSIALLKQIDNPSKLATVYSNLGNIYGIENRYQEAVRNFTASLEIFEREGLRAGESRMLHNLGVIYSDLGDHELALKYLEGSLALKEKLNQSSKMGPVLYNIGSVHYEVGKYELAVEYGERAMKWLLFHNDQFSAGDCYFLLAKSSLQLNQPKQALAYIDSSLAIDYEINNPSRIIQRLTLRANVTFASDPAGATKQAEEILTLIQPKTENGLKADLYLLLYQCYKASDAFDLSLEMHELHKLYSDSVSMEKDQIAIIKEAIQKEFEDKLEETEFEHEQEQDALKQSSTNAIYMIVGGSILLIILILLFARKRILAGRKMRDDLLSEIEKLKKKGNAEIVASTQNFELNRAAIEASIERKINETDWTVLNILLEKPESSNKEIAEKAFKSVDGIGSSLRRMYTAFEISPSKYMKISLLMEAIKRSNFSS